MEVENHEAYEDEYYDYYEYPVMGEVIDDFQVRVYDPVSREVKEIQLSDFAGKFLVLFFYPADFTFVCPTELKELNDMYGEFQKEGAEILVISKDTVFVHKAWVETEPLLRGFRIKMVEDRTGEMTEYFGVEDWDGNAQRATFIIDPDGVLRSVEIVDSDIGRSGKELLRKIRALKFVRENPGKVCPAESSGEVSLEPSIEMAGHVGDSLKS